MTALGAELASQFHEAAETSYAAASDLGGVDAARRFSAPAPPACCSAR